MNYLHVVYNVAECPLLNMLKMDIDLGERHRLFRSSSFIIMINSIILIDISNNMIYVFTFSSFNI